MPDHEHVQHFLPAGGWTWDWFGDPDQGFTKMQPGGWQFNIPPYIEQPVLHDPGIEQQPGRPHRDGPDPAERYELSDAPPAPVVPLTVALPKPVQS